jgi:glucose/arabinose dehydrogenase
MLLLAGLIPLATASAAPLRTAPVVAAGFVHPSDVTFAPGENGRLYVVEQRGIVRVVARGRVQRRAFLDIRRLVRTTLLDGLFSIAFHPGYTHDRRFYVDYVGRDGRLKLVEYRGSHTRTLLDVALGTDHYGGALAFGRDGDLYVGIGDGSVAAAAQDPASLRGKIVRLDVDDAAPVPEIVALGFRNPWRFAFDARGGLYVGDVGADSWEELDYVPSGASAPPNFGWNLYEGRHRTKAPLPDQPAAVTAPLLEYRHPAKGCAAVVAGPVFRGRYYYADLCNRWVRTFRLVDGRVTDNRREVLTVPDGTVSFGQGPRGAVYAVSLRGRLYRLAG